MQTRLFLIVPRDEARRIYAGFEREFEEDGLPLAMCEIDESRRIEEVSLYVQGDAAPVRARMQAVLDSLSVSQEVAQEAVPDIDWVARSLEGLAAIRAGRFLIHGAHERHKARVNDIAIEIEAGLAFGTGHHGTTAGCLHMIGRVLKAERPKNALDLGTGSAVLAIALARAARIPVLATDIDPIAIDVARANIALNHVTASIQAETAPGFHHAVFAGHAPFDLVVANILARPLMRLAPAMARHVAHGGSIILSGILERQRGAVLAAYVAQRFRHVATLAREGWVTLHLKR